MSTDTTRLSVRSTAFSNGGHIPPRYTCDGEEINPPLDISGYPENTKTLALIVEDPDAPRGVFTHWVAWNIVPNEPIAENSIAGEIGTNSFGKQGYGGPCPPSGVHRYYFWVYALDAQLQLPATSAKEDLQAAMQGHILAEGELMGLYSRK